MRLCAATANKRLERTAEKRGRSAAGRSADSMLRRRVRPRLQITAIVFLAPTFNGCSQAQARPALAVTGATVIDVAFDVTDLLANFPESGRIVPEMNDPNFLVHHNAVVFRD